MIRELLIMAALCAIVLLAGCFEGPVGPQGQPGISGYSSINGMWSRFDSNSVELILRENMTCRLSGSQGVYVVYGNRITFTLKNCDDKISFTFMLSDEGTRLSMKRDGYDYYVDYVRRCG